MSFQDVGKGQAARGRASSTNNGYSISSGANGDFSVPGQRRSSAAALQQRQGRGGGGGGFGSAGPLRTGGVGVGSRMPQGSYGRDASGVHQGGMGEPIPSGVAAGAGRSGGSSGGGKVGDYLMIYSVSMSLYLFQVLDIVAVVRCVRAGHGVWRSQSRHRSEHFPSYFLFSSFR